MNKKIAIIGIAVIAAIALLVGCILALGGDSDPTVSTGATASQASGIELPDVPIG